MSFTAMGQTEVEPDVVPAGTSLVVRTEEAVKTDRAFRTTTYEASLAQDILDQGGHVLIPRSSPVELAVRQISFLGPGGAGMSELMLGAQSISVNGVRDPVETTDSTDKRYGFEPRGAVVEARDGTVGKVLTSGRRINVPAETALIFHIIVDPIRLRGYRR
jgi:hypothetical protein